MPKACVQQLCLSLRFSVSLSLSPSLAVSLSRARALSHPSAHPSLSTSTSSDYRATSSHDICCNNAIWGAEQQPELLDSRSGYDGNGNGSQVPGLQVARARRQGARTRAPPHILIHTTSLAFSLPPRPRILALALATARSRAPTLSRLSCSHSRPGG